MNESSDFAQPGFLEYAKMPGKPATYQPNQVVPMPHDHAHHHADGHGKSSRMRLLLSLLITLIFVVVEAIAGAVSHSLALLTDAIHNVTDAAALALSWYALNLSERPAHAGKTFGYHRAGILAALANSITLAFIAAGICFEAWKRFQSPESVDANILMGVGSIALVVNLVTAWLVSHGAEHDLNLRSAFLHLLGDVLSTLGAIVAGVGIYVTGEAWLDPLVSVLIAVLILWNAWLIVRETLDILLESTPHDVEMSTMVRDLMQVDGVRGVHDLHVWSLARGLRVMSVHVLLDDMPLSAAGRIRHALSELVRRDHGVAHATFQFETAGCESNSLFCDIRQAGHATASTKASPQ
jgi:cobalt-zinc-cadmium efflux system protein